VRGISLIEEAEMDPEDQEFEIIDLRDLPGVVAKKWVNKKKRLIETIRRVNGMDALANEEAEEMERIERQR